MKKTRWMLSTTVVLVVAGLGFGLLGIYSRVSVQTRSGMIPHVSAYLPGDSEVVEYINVRNLVDSPAHEVLEKEHVPAYPPKI